MRLLLLSVLFCASFYSQLRAQNDSIANISYYFNDNLHEEKGILKLGVYSIIEGELPFSYELPITRSLTVEVGVGLLLPYYMPEFPNNRKLFDLETQKRTMGYSLLICPKYYIQQSYPESWYVGIEIRKKEFEQKAETIKYVNTAFIIGHHWLMGQRTILDVYYGVGYQAAESGGSNTHLDNPTTNNIIIPFNIKLGIIL